MEQLFSIKWTGENILAMEAFAANSNFSFVVGSNCDNRRWYHNWYEWCYQRVNFLPEWEPLPDPTILEVYLIQSDNSFWSILRPGDYINKNGEITRGPSKD